MSTKPSPKDLALRWFEEIWNHRTPDTIDALLHIDGVGNTEGGVVRGRQQVREALYEPLVRAFPDMKVVVDACIAEGNDAAVRWTVTGTQTGELMGIPPSNRKVTFSGMSWLVVRDGMLVSGWDRWNMSGLLEFLRSGSDCATVRPL